MYKQDQTSEHQKLQDQLLIQKIELSNHSNTEVQVSNNELERILKKYISFQINMKKQQRHENQQIVLDKPIEADIKFPFFQSTKQRLIKIMKRAYYHKKLFQLQFQELKDVFFLNQNGIKMLNIYDTIVIQTLRHAIFNLQTISALLVNVIIQMCKTNMVRESDISIFMGLEAIRFLFLNEQFEPPLDLYIEFINKGLIQPGYQQLMQIFIRNQFLFKSLYRNRQVYPSVVEKKKLIFHQFPYLLCIFERINSQSPTCFHFEQLKQYLNPTLSYLQFCSENCLLQRYLPQTKCRFLKIKSNLGISDIQFLFVALKSIKELSKEDFKTLFFSRPNRIHPNKQHQVKSWTKFWKLEELSQNIFTNKNFHLTQQQLLQMKDLLNFDIQSSNNLVQINLIFNILRQQSYNNQQFPKSLIKKISWIMKNIPDTRKIKQCCYILLAQYCRLVEQNYQKRADVVRQYIFPEEQIDAILEQGRQLALDILLRQPDQKFVFSSNKCQYYMEVVKDLIVSSKNKTIKMKAIQLYKNLGTLDAFREYGMMEVKLIEKLLQQSENGKKIGVEYIKTIFKILAKCERSSIIKDCLLILQNVVTNKKNGQQLPQNFQKDLFELLYFLYFYAKIVDECKHQIIKLAILCIRLKGTYTVVDLLIKIFVGAYSYTPVNSSLNINSSYGLYILALKFKQKSNIYYPQVKQYLDSQGEKILQSYRNAFSQNNKGSINILCAIIAMAKNQIKIPNQLPYELSRIAIKKKNYAQLSLKALFFVVRYNKSIEIQQKCLLNICQVLNETKNNQIIGIYILKLCLSRQNPLPASVKTKIQLLVKNQQCFSASCLHIYNFYKNHIEKLDQMP